MLNNWNREQLRKEFNAAKPYRFLKVDNFLEQSLLEEVINAYPSYGHAREIGTEFTAVNEKLKVQITDSSKFMPPIRRLSDILASSGFLEDLEYITGIPRLLADPQLVGGGVHVTDKSGRLDVHVDFNLNEEMQTHRRLNILVYLNPTWRSGWGGEIELWDPEVKHIVQSFLPIANRCVLFETSSISFHGVTPITCPTGEARKSFAAYYYTREAPARWDGRKHSTIFKARPDEAFRGAVLMPAERAGRALGRVAARANRAVRKLFR